MTTAAMTTMIKTASQIGKPPPGEVPPPVFPEDAASPVAGSGAPIHGGFFWAGGGLGTAGKLSVVAADAVRLMLVEFPVPVKPVYSVPVAGPAVTVSVPLVVDAGTVNQ